MYSHKRRSLQDDGSPTFEQRVDMCKYGAIIGVAMCTYIYIYKGLWEGLKQTYISAWYMKHCTVLFMTQV